MFLLKSVKSFFIVVLYEIKYEVYKVEILFYYSTEDGPSEKLCLLNLKRIFIFCCFIISPPRNFGVHYLRTLSPDPATLR